MCFICNATVFLYFLYSDFCFSLCGGIIACEIIACGSNASLRRKISVRLYYIVLRIFLCRLYYMFQMKSRPCDRVRLSLL